MIIESVEIKKKGGTSHGTLKLKRNTPRNLGNQRSKEYAMPHGQFMRIEKIAGGVSASNRSLIKSVHSLLTQAAKNRENRTHRHSIIRSAIALHNRNSTVFHALT